MDHCEDASQVLTKLAPSTFYKVTYSSWGTLLVGVKPMKLVRGTSGGTVTDPAAPATSCRTSIGRFGDICLKDQIVSSKMQ